MRSAVPGIVAAALLVCPAASAQAAAPEPPLPASPKTGLQVYSTNIENLQLNQSDGSPFPGAEQPGGRFKPTCYGSCNARIG